MSKKVDVSFMRMVNSEDDWKREVVDAGDKLMIIVDVFDPLWGPCEMMAGHLSNFYFDLGEKFGLKFVRAAANKETPSLAEFKDACKPSFLIYFNGEQVDRIDGADIPKIKGTIEGKAPKV
mmetsp:Transcript_53223/g.137671  ORF Transcript_53223/g.137671 Transcript_53223/m.137671 type:complete len:121 (-) Transcript_53223:239-601(-)|eukprot:CAMPEP_0115839720 /NCGR_PEP_ID=MMETSP0287-20121206/6397_1 /TAXON_ID=412157 /ORGANISM="Chrysochromulina rotalis, Strain UIO044" /LENGTH=120 /DNA_ID=CAMNT_0003293301 /DNA_START=93 /DNA_END=455 /DNA_ORIENTATION=-